MGTKKTAPKFKAHTNRIVPLGQVGKVKPAHAFRSLLDLSNPQHAYELGKVEGQTLIVDALREALRATLITTPQLAGVMSIIIDSHDKLVRDINAAAKRIKEGASS